MFFDRPEAGRKATVLEVIFPNTESAGLAEFVELARSADIDVVEALTAKRQSPHPKYYVGTGKLEEVKAHLRAADADLLLVDQELNPGQQRNLEAFLKCRVMTRTELILHIFADRARTYEGQLQVELAQLKHAQTRLIRGWTHLDRQKGGIGLKGAGETQLEMDQRMLGARLKTTQQKIALVSKRRRRNKQQRTRSQTPSISLVGYTNAGKSTLFNVLTNAQVTAKDRLFETLDPTMRRLDLAGMGEVVLADTVGFISDLPHSLVDAFRATLEEVAAADLLLHVVDAGADDLAFRYRQVLEVLAEIDASQVPTLVVLNKIDTLGPESGATTGRQERADLLIEMSTANNFLGPVGVVEVSALSGAGLDSLKEAISAELGKSAVPSEVLLAPEDGKTRAWLYDMGAVLDEQVAEDGRLALTIRADQRLLQRLHDNPGVLLQPSHGVPRISDQPQ